MYPSNEQVREVERAMAAHALAAWRSADARTGLADAEALVIHADALTRWSERLRMALRGDLTGDEDWLSSARPRHPIPRGQPRPGCADGTAEGEVGMSEACTFCGQTDPPCWVCQDNPPVTEDEQ